MSNKAKARFVLKHRFLIVKKSNELTEQQWDNLKQVFDYLPIMRTLWHFATEVRDLFDPQARVQTLWKRRAALLRDPRYQEVAELAEALELLEARKFQKMVAFSYSEAAMKVRTNNHVERANRRLRFAEKIRYKWRRRKWVVRYLVLALDRCWRQARNSNQPANREPRPQARAA